MKIWVDDIRPAPRRWWWDKTSKDAITSLADHKRWKIRPYAISLDHDLGGDDTTRPVVIWMIENDFWPIEVFVHSANPVGCDWLEGMIERYKK